MPVEKLRQFLDQNGVRYVRIEHSPAYTAQEIAASAHVPGRELAKTVVVEVDGDLALAVLPASCQIDLEHLKQATGAKRVSLASEERFAKAFPGCEPGAMPPFGNLYGLKVLVAPELGEDEEIAFNAGTHTELLRMRYRDFERLAKPRVLEFAAQPA